MQPLQPGGGFEVALHDGDFFSNSKTDDLNIRSMLDTQRIHIGTNSNRESSMMITSNTVFLNHDLFINRHLAVGKSNMIDEYPVDILGNTAIDGSINSTKYVLCRGLQLRRKIGGYYDTVDLPTGLLQGFSNDDYGIVIYTHGGSECNYFKFMASNTDIFHIEGSGNVGIGYSNPINKLDVAGAIYASNGLIIGSNYIWNNPNNLLISTTSNTSNLVIARPTGRIGVNTTSPAVILDIIATDAIRIPTGTSAQRPSAPQSGYIRFNTTTNSFEGYGGTAWGSIGGLKDTNQDTYITMESAPNANDDTIRFYTSNNEIVKILPSGFIGVSNTNPIERLELSGGNARFNSNVYIMTRLGVSNTTPTEAIDVIGNVSSSSNVYAMQRLGVRTKTPSEVVEIVGNTKVTNNAYVMNWLSVGTSNATTQFEVNGSAKISQDLEVGGNITIRGTTTSVDTQTVNIKDNIIQLNSGIAYNANLSAGIEINRGTGYCNFNILYDEPTDYLKIGFSGSTLQTIATREDNPPNMTIPFYDSTKYMYGSCNLFIYDKATGRLGIGKSNPIYTLDINGTVGVSNFIQFSNVDAGKRIVMWDNGSGGYNGLGKDGSSTTLALSSTSDHFKFVAYTSGTANEVARITGTGNLGIGTSSPGFRLDVQGDIRASGFIRPSSGSSTANGIYFPTDPGGGAGDGAWMRYYARTGDACSIEIGVGNDSDDHIYLNPTGNVGISTSTPAYKLDVNGDVITNWIRTRGNYGWYSETYGGGWQMTDYTWVRVYNSKSFLVQSTSTTSGISVQNADVHMILGNYANNNNAGSIQVKAGGSASSIGSTNYSLLLNPDGGNVGIGNVGPLAPLHVKANSINDPTQNGIYVLNPNNSANQHAIVCIRTAGSSGGNPFISWDIANEIGWCMGIDNSDSNKFKIASEWSNFNTTRMTITTDGNVGIGTTTPAYKLDVNGDVITNWIRTRGNYGWYSETYGGGWQMTDTVWIRAVGNKNIYTAGNIQCNGTLSGGNVGIGTTSPLTPLHVYANTRTYGILLENCEADDVPAKVILAGRIQSSLMPMMWSNTLYIYATSGTANVYYRWTVPITAFFTGQHAGVPDDQDIKDNITDYMGLIVSSADTGYVSYSPSTQERLTGEDAITINECLPNITLSSIDNDPAVFGVISDRKDNCSHNTDGSIESDSNPTFDNDLKDRVRVNSIGEGAIWVSNINGNLRNGDYITSSIIPGIGKRQDDDILHNYTVAKITMSCNFELNTGRYKCVEFEFNGQTYRKAFVGCTYHCG